MQSLENAESVGGSDLEDTVLTVPVWFTEKQRIELRFVVMVLSHCIHVFLYKTKVYVGK